MSWELVSEKYSLYNTPPSPPIKCVRRRLDTIDKKDYSVIGLLGDTHRGSTHCNEKLMNKALEEIFDKKMPVLLMGDILEMSSRHSIADGVYKQFDPNMQLLYLWNLIEALKKEDLILGVICGNHEKRLINQEGIDLLHNICHKLHVPYLGFGGWCLLYVGNQSYSIYAVHGSSGSITLSGKINAITKISNTFRADISAMGHVHECFSDFYYAEEMNKTTKCPEMVKKHIILTGHFLGYNQSYAMEKCYQPSKIGFPKIRLYSDEKNIEVYW